MDDKTWAQKVTEAGWNGASMLPHGGGIELECRRCGGTPSAKQIVLAKPNGDPPDLCPLHECGRPR